jgi:hypothetical protein
MFLECRNLCLTVVKLTDVTRVVQKKTKHLYI